MYTLQYKCPIENYVNKPAEIPTYLAKQGGVLYTQKNSELIKRRFAENQKRTLPTFHPLPRRGVHTKLATLPAGEGLPDIPPNVATFHKLTLLIVKASLYGFNHL